MTFYIVFGGEGEYPDEVGWLSMLSWFEDSVEAARFCRTHVEMCSGAHAWAHSVRLDPFGDGASGVVYQAWKRGGRVVTTGKGK